jgi:hypothetical protein
MNGYWKKPARLWHRRGGNSAPFEASGITQLDSGSLEAMVRAAVKADTQHPGEQSSLFIDVEAEQMLSWSEIKQLRRSPEFPIEI